MAARLYLSLLFLFFLHQIEKFEVCKLYVQALDTKHESVFCERLNGKNIREAYLTYPYHCCAFRFPRTHNPWEFARHAQLLKQLEEACARNNASLTGGASARHILQWQPLWNNHSSGQAHDLLGAPAEGEFFGGPVDPYTPINALCGRIAKNYEEIRSFFT